MAMIGNLETQAEAIAGKAGISPDKVKNIAQSLQGKIKGGSDPKQALEATAQEQGVPVEKVREVLGHAGLSGDKLQSFAKGLFG